MISYMLISLDKYISYMLILDEYCYIIYVIDYDERNLKTLTPIVFLVSCPAISVAFIIKI